MANVVGTATVNLAFTQTNSAGLINPLSFQAVVNQINGSYANGTGANQLNLMYASQFSLSSSTLAIDLTSLTDLAGAAVNMLRVREFVVQVITTASGQNVTVYASASSGWSVLPGSASAISVLANGGMFRLSDPITVGSGNGYVTGASSKKLVVDGSSSIVTGNLLILGCSAVS